MASSTSRVNPASRASATSSRFTFARTCSPASGCSRLRPRRASRTVFASSSSIYGDAAVIPDPRGHSAAAALAVRGHEARLRAPRACIRAGVRARRRRPRYFTIYGPRQRPDMAFAKSSSCLAEGRPFELHGDGTQSRSFTFVQDAVEATILAMERRCDGPDLQRRRRRRGLDARRDRAARSVRRPPARAHSQRHAASGDQRARPQTSTLIERELGWRPETPFEQGLAAQWRWAAGRVAAA